MQGNEHFETNEPDMGDSRMASDEPVRALRAPVARNWWASRWARSLTGVLDAARLTKARSYVRRGQVVDLDIQVGLILASVLNGGNMPQRVRIEVKTLGEDEWDRVLGVLSDRASYAAQLLNGQMPHEVEDAFQLAGVSLFPTTSRITTTCTCADVIKPCQHAAAVLLLVGEVLDRDPFLMLTLRGRSRAQIMSALRNRRAQMADDENVGNRGISRAHMEDAQLADRIDDFWHLDQKVRELVLHVQMPEVDYELLKRLGSPAFAEDEQLDARLARVYDRVSRRAIEVAYHESPAMLDSSDEEE